MNGFQALLTFLGILVITNGDLLEKYTRGTGNVYHGRYSRDVHEPEFLIPRRVFEDGSFNTYSLPNYYDREEISERGKRSIEAEETEPGTDKLHLVLPFNGIEHHVELNPYHEFISPDMVIETRGAGLRTNMNEAIRFKRVPDQQCHYRGFVRGHQGSKAALSLCDGVAGYVHTNHGRYFIEPLKDVEPESDGQHVHIAYERSIPHEMHGKDGQTPKKTCGTSDNWEASWAESLAQREKQLMEENSGDAKRAAPASTTHSIHRYVEVAVVTDRMFLDYHNGTNYEQYVLTLMNMVADYYHDSSSGNQIDVVIVRIIYLEKEKEEIDLRISPKAEEALDSFIAWSVKLNPADMEHPNHFDVAVLITRYDICSEGTGCQLLGLAYVSKICDPKRAGTINEDTGLMTGITIAHEIGHTLGCSHDEGGPNACEAQDKSDGSTYVMSPFVNMFTLRWSPCSRTFMTQLFEKGLGECLTNNPRNPPEKLKLPNMLPGAMYDTDAQCNLVFPGSKFCTGTFKCEQLWCHMNNTCYSRNAPIADGTKCGENKWCFRKECVDMGTRPQAVHGGWGSWSAVGSCSRTCGGGLKFSERECNKPVPSNRGRYCLGERKKFMTCNTQPCDPTKPPFRAVQCTEYNTKSMLGDGKLYKWRPYFYAKAPCDLVCMNENDKLINLPRPVNDTTPCKPGTNDMCISGVCRKVGCDWVLDGNAVEDKCGICKGDGTKCKKVQGLFDSTNDKQQRVKVVTIPKGARSISVKETIKRKNILSAKPENGNKYCINGGNVEFRDGDYECVNSMLLYTHPEPQREEIDIKGPIGENLLIEYVFYEWDVKYGVSYTYYVPSSNPSYTPKYIWDFMEWTNCDASCGGGTMISEATCIEEHGGKVTLSFCSGIPKPEPKSRVCNMQACPAKWRVSQWSKCSACDNKKGWKHRKVQCVKPAARAGEDDVQANFDACKGRLPKQKDECIGKRPCRKSCAKKTRNVDKDVENLKEKKSVPVENQGKMIDSFVDLSLARYLEKAHGISSESEADDLSKVSDSADLRLLLRDWSSAEEAKKKRSTCPPGINLTKPKEGSIIHDKIPTKDVILLQAPYMDSNLQQNLSDKAYQESGDLVGGSIDTSREKVYQGMQAIEKIETLINRNETRSVPSSSSGNNDKLTYDRLAKLVDPADQP